MLAWFENDVAPAVVRHGLMPEGGRCCDRSSCRPSECKHTMMAGSLQRVRKGHEEAVSAVSILGEIGSRYIGHALGDDLAVDDDRDLDPLLRIGGIPAPTQRMAVTHTL